MAIRLTMTVRDRWIGLSCALVSLALSVSPPVMAADDVKAVSPDHAARMKQGAKLFAERVRPLLLSHCLDCHGGRETKADFSLRTREEMLDSGHVDLEQPPLSWLLQVIRHEQEPHMPLKQEKLADQAIADITRWIELGAPYDTPLVQSEPAADTGEMRVTAEHRQFWSFRPLGVTAPPRVVDGDLQPWARTPVDAFVAQQLAERGLRPNRTADRRTLIRRAYLDLIGLPPTADEIERFVKDTDEQAYARIIDRLLESKHYGERWARHWMDVARFAESGGFEHDDDRPHAYHYRDFLIRAFNDDMPFDQFIAWQLAGDELAPDDPLAMRATGFLGAGVFPSQLTEAEFESARYDELDDIVTTTGVAFLGLSIGCARCHDHKFDPIPSEDYYRLAAAFTKTIRSHVEVPVDPQVLSARRAEHQRQLSEAAMRLSEYEAGELEVALNDFLLRGDLSSLPARPWRVLRPDTVTSSSKTELEIQPDDSVLALGEAADQEVITWEAVGIVKGIQSIQLEALTHDSLPQGGPGRAKNGNFVLGRIEVEVQPEGANEGERQKVKLVSAAATHQQDTGTLSVASSIDNDPNKSGWAVDRGGIGKDQAAAFVFGEPLDHTGPAKLIVNLTMKHPNKKHTLGRFRISLSAQADAVPQVGDGAPSADVIAALETLREDPDKSSRQWQLVRRWFAARQPRWQKLNARVQQLESQRPPTAELVQVNSAGLPKIKHHADGRGYPHFYPETFVLIRGDVNQKKTVALPGYVQVLMPADATAQQFRVAAPERWTRTPFDRASLANWITDTRDGPGGLAARVIVNRLWHHHFGRGIVSTPNDFGLQGERPTHPELLDWLSTQLVTGGWRLKPIHKMIMTSATYMQSAEHDETRAGIDPDNKLLWRHVPRRLEGEAIRDSVLATSGLLDRSMYGPGSRDEQMRRRSVYFTIKRSGLIPSMIAFDWPEHLVSIGRRTTTTVAPQALVFLNGPQTRQCAETLAGRLKNDATDLIGAAYRSILGRPPDQKERELAEAFLSRQSLIHRDRGDADGKVAALADLCQTLYCTNEFVYVE